MSLPHKKARCFTFIDIDDQLILSIVTDDGVHQNIGITASQGCLAYAQMGEFAIRQMRKGLKVAESESLLPPCDV